MAMTHHVVVVKLPIRRAVLDKTISNDVINVFLV